jgi:hypothetical protein
MTRTLKWAIPAVAVVALVIGWSMRPLRAEDAPATQPAKGTINGVAMFDGQPAVGAMVRLMKPAAGRLGRAQQGAGTAAPTQQAENPAPKAAKGKGKAGKPAGRPEPLATATVDANGHFTLTDVAAGDYVVAAGIRGRAIGRTRVHVSDGQTLSVTIELRERPANKPQL